VKSLIGGLYLILGIGIVWMPVLGQGGKRTGWGGNVYGGFVASHHEYLQQLDAHTLGLELRYTVARHPGDKPWSDQMRLPRSGIALLYVDQGQPSLTGKAIALIPHQEFRMFSFQKGSVYFRLGTGLAWLSRRYDAIENRKQIAIGAHVNPVMQFSFLWHQRISSKWETDFGIGLTHYSNGNFNLPNFGMNLPNVHVGLTRVEGYHARPLRPDSPSGPWRKEWDLSFNGATKEEGIASFTRYAVWGLSARYQQHKGRLSRIFAGGDFFLDNTYRFRSGESRQLNTIAEAGLTLGHRLMMGPLCLFTEVGVYVLRPDKIKAAWYQRLGLNYFITEKYYAGVYLKTHMAQSDYVQFTIGRLISLK
jgi:hypothetical protein